MADLTADERELLTDEELEALDFDEKATNGEDLPEETPDAPPAEKEVDEVKAGEKSDKTVTDDKDKSDEPPADPIADEKPDENPVEIPEAKSIEVDFIPNTNIEITQEVKDHIAAESEKLNVDLNKSLADLKDKYDDGDIDVTEYIERSAKIRDDINDNRADVRDKVVNGFREQQVNQQRWNAEQDAFFKLNPGYDAPKYEGEKLLSGSPVMYGALDAACNHIAKHEPNLSGIDLLIKAKAMVDKDLGIVTTDEKGNKRPSAKRPGMNLSDIPESKGQDTGNGEFAHLDKLDGDNLEEALSKLTEEQQSRYLAG